MVKSLPSKYKVWSSNPSTSKNKQKFYAGRWWLRPVILATQEAEIRGTGSSRPARTTETLLRESEREGKEERKKERKKRKEEEKDIPDWTELSELRGRKWDCARSYN
jgi:hypothetical protein